MKKIISLLKACLTNDMNIFKIRQKKDNRKNGIILPLLLSFVFMFAIWSNANMIFEKLAPLHLQVLVISIVVFGTSIMVIIEGVYNKLSNTPNSTYNQLWLQNMTYTQDKENVLV